MADLNFVLNLKDNATIKVKQFGEQIDKATKKGDDLNSSLGEVGSKLKGMGAGGVATAGLAAVGAAFAGISVLALKTADDMSQIWESAMKVGASTEFFSAMKYTAGQAGIEIDGLTNAFAKLNIATIKGNESFSQIGISLQNANGESKKTEEVFLEVADRFAQMEDGAQKTALAVSLFGKSGTDLIPLLNQGADALRDQNEQAKELGLTFDDLAGAKADTLADSFGTLKSQIGGIFMQMGAAAQEDLIPVIEFVGEMLKGWAPILASVSKGLATSMRWTVGIFEAAAGSITQILSWLFKTWDLQLQTMLKGINAVRGFFGASKIEATLFTDLGARFQSGADAIFESAANRFQAPVIDAEARRLGGVGSGVKGGGRSAKTKAQKAELDEGYDLVAKDFERKRKLEEDQLKAIEEASRVKDEIYLNSLNLRAQTAKTEAEQLDLQMIADIERTRQEYAQKMQLASEAGVSSLELMQQQAIAEQAIIDQTEAKKKELHKAELDRIQAEKEAKQDLAMAYFNVARQIFPKIKGLAIAEAMISGAVAIQRALAAPPGFPFNAFQVGLATAQTAAQINTIRQQRFALGGMIQGSNVLIRANENGQEAVVNARATRVLGSDGVRAINEGRFADLVAKLTGSNRGGGGGISINISGGMVDRRFVERELLPLLKSATARF
jgi:hypothetical protein